MSNLLGSAESTLVVGLDLNVAAPLERRVFPTRLQVWNLMFGSQSKDAEQENPAGGAICSGACYETIIHKGHVRSLSLYTASAASQNNSDEGVATEDVSAGCHRGASPGQPANHGWPHLCDLMILGDTL